MLSNTLLNSYAFSFVLIKMNIGEQRREVVTTVKSGLSIKPLHVRTRKSL